MQCVFYSNTRFGSEASQEENFAPNKETGVSKTSAQTEIDNDKENANSDKDELKKDIQWVKEETPEPSLAEPLVLEDEETPTVTNPENVIKEALVDVVILIKPMSPFIYNVHNGSVNSVGYLKSRKRKFAITLEFENLVANHLKNTLDNLPANELAYRKHYETNKRVNNYGINLTLQRGGFGVITGIGLADASINTNYVTRHNTYESVTKYQMIKESIPYSGGYYSRIREYDDTIATHAQESRLTG